MASANANKYRRFTRIQLHEHFGVETRANGRPSCALSSSPEFAALSACFLSLSEAVRSLSASFLDLFGAGSLSACFLSLSGAVRSISASFLGLSGAYGRTNSSYDEVKGTSMLSKPKGLPVSDRYQHVTEKMRNCSMEFARIKLYSKIVQQFYIQT